MKNFGSLKEPESRSGAPALVASLGCVGGGLDPADVLRLQAFPALRYLIGDLIPFVESLEPIACYPSMVHEEIFSFIVRLDEAVALVLVEPLHRSLGHVLKTPAFLPWVSV
jgi:hypothetical protein